MIRDNYRRVLDALCLGTATIALASGTQIQAQPVAATSNVQAVDEARPRDFSPWGVALSSMDKTVKPGDDFYSYVNGGWYARTEIPADQSSAGIWWDVRKVTEGQLRQIITEAPAESQLGKAYGSFMDTDRLDQLGLSPLQPRLDEIANLPDQAAFTRDMGAYNDHFGGTLFEFQPYADPNKPDVTGLFIVTSGLGLPDRDYYLDERFAEPLAAYRGYLNRIFTMTGAKDPSATAEAVLGFETELAKLTWSATDRNDIAKLNNPMTVAELQQYAPEVNWQAYLTAAALAPQRPVLAGEKSSFAPIAALYAKTPLPVLKAWQTARAVDQASPYLSDAFVQSQFAFKSKLNGQKELRPRWTRGVALIDQSIGELLGKAYVERHFPPEAKAEMTRLVANLKVSMAHRIETNSWMAPETRAAALAKLEKMDVMVGYPDKFRDYSALKLNSQDLLGNVARVRAFDWDYESAKVDKPVDKSLWGMTPQTLNAYNGAFENKIVFPAGILQPPFFSLAADDAVNYGAIGAVIGHEITHGFDDDGRKIDKDGALKDWWTAGDASRFEGLAKSFGSQYAAFEPVPGHFINPELTMGENLADMAGLRVAYDAYHASLGSAEAPVIGGLTGDQRFFLAFAQVWQGKYRDEGVIQQLATDPHSPVRFRVLGPLPNIDEWYAAFGVKPGDAMYLPPEKRVKIW